MQQAGLRQDQVSQVRGFADQRLRNAVDPFDASNRRISIIVQYLTSPADEDEKSAASAAEAANASPESGDQAPAENAAEKNKADDYFSSA
jgi:chemotaxis protein MotB